MFPGRPWGREGTQRPGLQHERLSILLIMSVGLLSSTVLCGVSADYPPYPDLDHLQPGRSCVFWIPGIFLWEAGTWGWTLRDLQIISPPLLTLVTQWRPWVIALVPTQPGWEVSPTGYYPQLNESIVLGKCMVNSHWGHGKSFWRKGICPTVNHPEVGNEWACTGGWQDRFSLELGVDWTPGQNAWEFPL